MTGKQVYIYGIGGADKQYKVLAYCFVMDEEVTIRNILYQAAMLKARNPSVGRYGYFYFAPEHLIKVPNDKKQNLEDYTMNSHEDINTAMYRAGIKNVIFNAPATIVFWADGTKTIVKCGPNDIYDPEKGLAMAIAKKHFGNDNCFHKIFKQWLPKEEEK